jgi:hypothetical protein
VQRISTEAHAALDVLVASFLIALPWIVEIEDVTRARGWAIGTGAGLAALALLTRYELGVVPVIPMPVHLVVDALAGIMLLTFALGAATAGAETRVWLVFLLVGLAELGAAGTTDPVVPEGRRLLARAAS